MADVEDTTNARFPYPDLDANRREIRLLTPERIDADGVLHCSLGSFALDENTAFVALSYEWKKEPAVHHIIVNGQEFKVRPNLNDFLTVVAAPKLLGSKIFIDAIGIDQTNKLERNSQVQLMRDIYSGAQKVIAWLGRLDSNHDMAENLMWNSFWTRTWVVQEIVLARDLEIRVGDFARSPDFLHSVTTSFTDGDDFTVAQQSQFIINQTEALFGKGWILQMVEKHDGGDTNPRFLHTFARACKILKEREKWQCKRESDGRPPLYEVLEHYGMQQSSERRDKFFGLLGLARSQVNVDYGTSLLDLYLRVLLEGLYEQDSADGSADDLAKEYPNPRTQYSRCYRACTLALVPEIKWVLLLWLTTYRALQHCGAIPLTPNLHTGIRHAILEYVRGTPPLVLNDRRIIKGSKSFLHVYSWLAAFVACIALQYLQCRGMKLGLPGDTQRTFDEWIATVDEIADDMDLKTGSKRPLPWSAVGPQSEWRNKRIRGILGGAYVIYSLEVLVDTLEALWRMVKKCLLWTQSSPKENKNE